MPHVEEVDHDLVVQGASPPHSKSAILLVVAAVTCLCISACRKRHCLVEAAAAKARAKSRRTERAEQEQEDEKQAESRREARRKENNARGPLTTGALYRRSTSTASTAGRLDHEELEWLYGNADVSEMEPDPMQARWNAISELNERGHDHDQDRSDLAPRRTNTVAPLYGNSRGEGEGRAISELNERGHDHDRSGRAPPRKNTVAPLYGDSRGEGEGEGEGDARLNHQAPSASAAPAEPADKDGKRAAHPPAEPVAGKGKGNGDECGKESGGAESAAAIAGSQSEREAKASSDDENSLKGSSRLWASRNPAVTTVQRWFGGVVLKIDPDGNCFGTAWMVSALVWAVQCPRKIARLAAAIDKAVNDEAFPHVEEESQIHVTAFIGYVGNLRDSWRGESTPDPAALAVGVVKTLLGSAAEGEEEEKGEGKGEKTWLSLKWGIAVVARALDVWCIGDRWEADQLCKLRTFGESVDPLIGVDPVALSRPGGAGRDHGGLQPGEGVGLLVGLVTEYLVLATGQRNAEDLTDLFRPDAKANGDEVVGGVKLLFGGAVHHYDVLVETGTALEGELRKEFGLHAKPFESEEGLQTLRDGVASQEVTLPHEILDLVGGDDGLAKQKAAFEAMMNGVASQASQAVTPPHDIWDIVGGEDGLLEQKAALEAFAMARTNAGQGQV